MADFKNYLYQSSWLVTTHTESDARLSGQNCVRAMFTQNGLVLKINNKTRIVQFTLTGSIGIQLCSYIFLKIA